MSAWTKTKEFLKPVYRSLVCLILCAALILGCFPQKAEAVALEAALGIGVAACLILMTAGVVFNPKTMEDIQAIGHDFQTFMYEWGTSAEKLDEVEDWFSGLSIINPEGDDGPGGYGRTTVNLARGLLVGISLWVASIALNKHTPSLPSSSLVPADYSVTYSLVPSNSSYGNAYLYSPFSNGTITSSISVTFDGSILSISTESNKTASVCVCSAPFLLDDGYYYLDCGSVIPLNPGPSKYDFAWGVFCYDSSDGSCSSVVSRSYSFTQASDHGVVRALDPLEFYASNSYQYFTAVAFSGSVSSYDEFMGFELGRQLSIKPSDGESKDFIITGNVKSDLESGAISEEEVPLYNLNYADVLPQGKPVLESIQDLSAKLASGELTVEEYLEMGHATVSGASEPVFTEDLDFEWFPSYYVGETPPVYSVDAISPDGGTIFYQWHLSGGDNSDFIITEYSSEESAKSFTVPLDTPGIYHLWCMAENRVYSDTLGEYEYFVAWKASSVASLRVLESDVNVDPDPGVDPDPDPDVNQDLADKVGSAVGDAFNQAGQSEKTEANNTGSDLVGQLTDVIPNYSEGFVTAFGAFASNFSYEGTDAILTVPQIRFPEIPGKTKGPPLVKSFVMMDEKQVDFSEFAEMMPEQLLLLVQCLLTAALIVFCGKELYDTISYVLTLRKGE